MDEHYVSRGGIKLRGALDAFGIQLRDKNCLDVGSSTGGFTDCLLKSGARSVWAVDVGWGLLDYNLRKDPRVHVLERTNFRFFDISQVTEKIDLITVDVSFISLEKIFPKMTEILGSGGEAIVLVKPQFESAPKDAPGGIIRDEAVRQATLRRVHALAEQSGFKVLGTMDSTLKGRKGNQETFLHLATNLSH